jgi:Zn-dependent alcohol dehydrogenase
MQVAVCRAFGKPLVIEEATLAGPGPGEIEVEVAACAICHSDILYADGGWGGQLPAVYGHEAAGKVIGIGAGVMGFEKGDHVVVTLIRACGSCPACAEGNPVTCETRFPMDARSPLKTRDGEPLVQGLKTAAFAERVTVVATQAVAVPKHLPLDAASLLACGVITGFGAVANTAKVRPGASVAVIGCGGVGLNAIQGAAIVGARQVIAIDVIDSKLQVARTFGATDGLRGDQGDAAAEVRKLTGGRGVDYVFVSVGAKAAFDQAYGMAAKSGAIVFVGIPANGVMSSVDVGVIASDNQRILGSKMGGSRIRADIPHLVSLWEQKKLKLEELISGRFELSQINEAMAGVKKGTALRNVIAF